MATNIKRVQGRPVRGEGDVGRDRLIEAARIVLRSHAGGDLSRKAVAEAAGVTPALVSYYFPDKNSLMAAATEPVLKGRLDQLHAILDSGESREAQLRGVVALFVSFNAAEAHLLDHYIHLYKDEATEDDSQKLLLTGAYMRLFDFYLQGVEAGDWRRIEPDLFVLGLWGMCKFVAQSRSGVLRMLHVDAGRRASSDTVEMILEFALNGVRSRLSSGQP